jgi:hypothetical protein
MKHLPCSGQQRAAAIEVEECRVIFSHPSTEVAAMIQAASVSRAGGSGLERFDAGAAHADDSITQCRYHWNWVFGGAGFDRLCGIRPRGGDGLIRSCGQ